jgi:hypothetical protein
MYVLLGAAYQVDDDSVENDHEYAENLLLSLCHSDMPHDERGTVIPIAVWASAEPVTEVRNAVMTARNLKAMFTPEFGLTEQGKKLLEKSLQDAAEAAAEAQSQSQE